MKAKKNASGKRVASNDGFDTETLDDLAALVRRLAHSLRKAAPDNDLPEKALDYLLRKGLQGSPLRKVSNGHNKRHADTLTEGDETK
mgnify:CR=1 FL=1